MGVRNVNYSWTTSSRSLDEVQQFAVGMLADVLRRAGYRLVSRGPDEIVMVRPARSNPGLLLFSVFAYLLSTDRACQVVVSWYRTPAGKSRMTVVGDVPSRLATELTELPQG